MVQTKIKKQANQIRALILIYRVGDKIWLLIKNIRI